MGIPERELVVSGTVSGASDERVELELVVHQDGQRLIRHAHAAVVRQEPPHDAPAGR
jgi:hypothetical protein